VILYRHCDRRFPFLWESSHQPPARWHGEREGPVQYLADTPNGAWAEFLRHEGIREEADLDGVQRALWCVDVPVTELDIRKPSLGTRALRGGLSSYDACRTEARRLRSDGAEAIEAPSAALTPGGAGGWVVDGGEREAPSRDGKAYVLFGRQPDCIGWPTVETGTAPARVLRRVRHL
jgi:hypothetical protein